MSRKIYGKVIDEITKRPLSGARIRAWDEDIGADDLMGECISDTNGEYIISYHDGHWDSSCHKHTIWRPDIYVTVALKCMYGNWVRIFRTKTYEDHKLRNDLKININVKIYSDEFITTGFDPKKYGYHFQNSFDSPITIFNMDTFKWGFCGGMSAGANRNFINKQIAPTLTVPPKRGSGLYKELFNRQVRSLLPNNIGTILDWQSAPDEGHFDRKHSVGYRTKKQWKILKDKLQIGIPTVLILIRTEGYLSDFTKNHQVLAYAYNYNRTTKDLKIHVYDPNSPNKTEYLTMNLGLPNSRLNAKDSTDERLRGFIVNQHTAHASVKSV